MFFYLVMVVLDSKLSWISIIILFSSSMVFAPFPVLVVSVVAFLSMLAGGILANFFDGDTTLKVVGHGLGSGTMLASVFVILTPKAFSTAPVLAGIGVSLGYAVGYTSHELAHVVSHGESIPLLDKLKQAELTLHSAIAGTIIGVTYGSIPELSLVFGLGIVAHKLPAGLTTGSAVPVSKLVFPASAVGLLAVPSYLLLPSIPVSVQSIMLGVSTGVFLHIAIDMTPECVSSPRQSGHGVIQCSSKVDRQRVYASISVLLGVILISGLFLLT
jgi:ZIP family zinc transporter